MKLRELLNEGKEELTFGSVNYKDVEKIISDHSADIIARINGYVNLSEYTMDELPFEMSSVSGYFDAERCGLTTLKGCPDWVGDVFNCNHNRLDTLSYGPSTVQGGFSAAYNQLTDLSFMPTQILYWIDVSENQISSLHGVPDKINGDFNVSFNKIDSFRFGPTEVSEDYDIHDNELSSFDHAPNHVGGAFNVFHNKIKSLKNIHSELLSCPLLDISNNPIEEGGIGLILIEGLNELIADDCGEFTKAAEIISKYLGQGKAGLLECQEELENADLGQFAEL